MKTKLIIFFFCIICLIGQAGHGQKVILKITQNYFRYGPFQGEFKNFLTHLIYDSLLDNSHIVKRTDSTLFFFRGTYKKYNTFDLTPTRVEVRLAETEIGHFQYQILIYTSPQTDAGNNVVKAFERFDRKYRTWFSDAQSKSILEKNEPTGIIRDYYIGLSPFAPVTIAYKNSKNDENLFAITIRFIVRENVALIP